MSTVGFVIHAGRASAVEAADALRAALASDGVETLALSSTARSPVRVTIEVPREEVDELAQLLAEAQALIETLRQGLGLVPDSLPDLS